MSVGFRLLSSLPFALAAMLFSMCSEPAPPEVVPPITQPDTTTHEYTWEYHVFGQSPVSTSWFRVNQIVNDDNLWRVGDVQIDTIIYTRSGLSTQRVTAVHWDGKKFTPYALEGLTLSGQVSGVPIYAVEGREGSVYFMSSGSCTEMRDDPVAIHDLRSKPYLKISHTSIEVSTTGKGTRWCYNAESSNTSVGLHLQWSRTDFAESNNNLFALKVK